MRAFLVCVFFYGLNAYATKVDSVVRQYDDGKTRVTSPHIDAEASFLHDRARVNVGYAMDILTSASSDVKSYASKEISDTRKEVSGGLNVDVPNGTVGVGFVQSDENDYHSKTYSVGASRDFFEKNTVMGIGLASGFDNVRSSADTTFDRNSNNLTYSFSVTQILSPLSLMQFLYDLRQENGYLASPYRRARLSQADGSVVTVPEVHPPSRTRNSLALKYNYQFKKLDLSLANSFRFYFDTWGVNSYTLEERLTKPLSKKVSLSLSLRYYTQKAAGFYMDKYETLPSGFVTGNKTLATYNSILAGLRPTYILSDKVSLFAKFEYYLQKFQDHTDVGNTFDASDDTSADIEAKVIGIGFNALF